MNHSTITCKNCGQEIEISEALTHQIQESVRREESEKFSTELEKAKKEATEKALKDIEQKTSQEIIEKQNQIEELTKRAQKAENEELKMRKEKRDFEEAKEKFELEKQRQLDEEREKIRAKAVEEIEVKDKFKFAEYETKIAAMNKALEDAKKQASQVSQQLQGEVLELDLENSLREIFTDDEIEAVGKGQLGGDIIQKVKGKSGRVAGIILWETKRAKWSSTWFSKLREDSRRVGASVSILLSIDLPKDIQDFQLTEGVIVCSYKYAVPLASIVRRSVLQIAVAKQTAANKDENLELLYSYIQSESFRHRFEAFAEGIKEMEEDLEYEKRAMERVWKKREGQIKKTLINASRMYGELQGVMGNALPDIKTFSLPEKIEE
jgi:hypothetical protein